MSKKKRYNLIPVIVIAVLLVIWQLACAFELVPGYMLPSPIEVVKAFISDFPLLMSHAKVTILEAVLGLVIGVLLGFGCAALMDSFPLVKKGLYPILVLTQTIPPVAIAPLLILWFSYGIAPKVILVVLVAFFPMAVGLLEGFSGLKIAVAYSIVGAVIAEWLGGFSGLGVYMTRVKKSLSYDKMFAVIFFVSAISLILMALVKYIQYKAMPWEHTEDK